MDKPIGVQLDDHLAARATLIEELETIHASSSAEERDLTEDEQKRLDEIHASVTTENETIERLGKAESLLAATVTATPSTRRIAKPAIEVIEATAETIRAKVSGPQWGTHALALMAHCLHKGHGNPLQAAAYAERNLHDPAMAKVIEFASIHGENFQAEMIKAADPGAGTSSDAAFVGPLMEWRQASNMFIELWRAKTVLGRLPTIGLSFGPDLTVTIPRQTAGSTGSWVAEASAIPVGAIALDEISLTPKEQGTIIVLTKRAIDHSNPSALAVVQNDLIEASARNVDSTWLDANASTPARPRGGFNGAATSPPSALAGLAAMDEDAQSSLNHFSDNDIPEVGMTWEMHPGMKRAIAFARDGNGNVVFPEVEANGTWHGVPIVDSTQCTRTTLDLVAAGHVIVADDYGPMIDLSGDASLHMEDVAPSADIGGATSPVRNMFQTNSTAIRLTQGIDWDRRRDSVCHRITSVVW